MTSAEDREKKWWDDWWEKDWSWEALVDRPWQNGLTLQDYWRDQEDHLVKGPNGKHYTRAHTPLEWPAGTDLDQVDAPKNQWSEEDLQALADDLAARLEYHRRRTGGAVFDGAVLPIVPLMPKAGEGADEPLFRKPASFTAKHAWLQPRYNWSAEQFGECDFWNALISGKTSFERASFRGDSRFGWATFCNEASFEEARFGGSAIFSNTCFLADANFGSTSYDGDASFWRARFDDKAVFYNASFSDDADFELARFSGDANFWNASFSGHANFWNASFVPAFPKRTTGYSEQISALKHTNVTFQGATFEKMTHFNVANLTSFANYSRRTFHAATFKGHLYTEGDDGTDAPFSIGAFDGAQIERLIFLDPSQTTGDGDLPTFLREQLASTDQMEPALREKNLRSIAEGARVLQIAMEKGRNREAEQFFHRVEMIARRKLNGPAFSLFGDGPKRIATWLRERVSTLLPAIEVPDWRRFVPRPWKGSIRAYISDRYALFSNYGSSIHRPLITLAATWFIMGLFYWSFSFGALCNGSNCGWKEAGREFVPAMTFSAQTALVPTYPLTVKERVASSFEKELLFEQTPIGRTKAGWIGIVAFLQSILSPVLIFLTILAARRYYQLG